MTPAGDRSVVVGTRRPRKGPSISREQNYRTRDTDLVEVVKGCEGETATQLKWLKTRMKQAAPQALVVAS